MENFENSSKQALVNSTLALDRIARHEAQCGKRWGLVVKLLALGLMQMWGLLTFLLADKLNWIS